MYTLLLEHIARYVHLTDEETAILQAHLRVEQVPKKAQLLTEGQVANTMYFVLSGCLRSYFINEKGGEQLVQFAIEQWWMADYLSMNGRVPSSFYFQAVEATTVAALDQHQRESLLEQVPKLERYFRIVLEKANGAAAMRIKYIYSFSGEERYLHFSRSFPAFVQRVPQYMLASYLGFTPEFLSKIRAKK